MKINKNLLPNWKLLGTTTGTQEINLPEDFNELLVIPYVNNNINLKYPMLIPKIELTDLYCGFNSGYFGAGQGQSGYVRVRIKLEVGRIETAFSNSVDVTSASICKWYIK